MSALVKSYRRFRFKRLDFMKTSISFCLKFFLKATQLQKMVEDLEQNTVEVRNAKGLLADHIKVKLFLICFLRFLN